MSRKRHPPHCSVCNSTADVQYAPHPNTIPGAAHGGRWICASCLFLEEHPDAARIERVRKPKVPQEESLFDARSEARYDYSEADAQTEAAEAARWGLGGADSAGDGTAA